MKTMENLKPLIDADILLYEIGWSGEFKDKEEGYNILLPYDAVGEILEKKIDTIVKGVNSNRNPLLFLSNSPELVANENRISKEGKEFIPNFRYEVAKTRPYKGTRKNPKPYHFSNILTDIIFNWDVIVSPDGLEADDALAIYQCNNENTVICSRDKDLRITPGWHYSWECGNQKPIGPVYTDKIGWLDDSSGKIIGYGLSFFYYQMIVGDNVDNIPGLPKAGPIKAFKVLKDLKTEEVLFKTVFDMYKEAGLDEEYFMEQANLLWIRQEEGVGYTMPC